MKSALMTRHHCLLWEHSWTSETHAENTRRCADDGQLEHCAMTVFFFLFFFKEMLGLSRALHSWRASWFHTRQESCLNKPPAVSPSTPSLPQETTTALKSTSGERWGLRRVIWSDGSQRRSHFGSKLYWKNTHWLGLSVPLGSHYNWPINTASYTTT